MIAVFLVSFFLGIFCSGKDAQHWNEDSVASAATVALTIDM